MQIGGTANLVSLRGELAANECISLDTDAFNGNHADQQAVAKAEVN